jgi:hypothetical protein
MVKILKDDTGRQLKAYERGFYVGFKATIDGQKDIKFFLHNHLRFNILYNRDAATDLSRIVGFEVEAFSVNHQVRLLFVVYRLSVLQLCYQHHEPCGFAEDAEPSALWFSVQEAAWLVPPCCAYLICHKNAASDTDCGQLQAASTVMHGLDV